MSRQSKTIPPPPDTAAPLASAESQAKGAAQDATAQAEHAAQSAAGVPKGPVPNPAAMASGAIPGAPGLPSTPLPGAAGLPGGSLPGAGALAGGSLPGAAGLPGGAIPGAGALAGGSLPGAAGLPGGSIPGAGALAGGSLPGAAGLPGGAIPGAGALAGGSLPGAAGLPGGSIPGAGALAGGSLPGAGGLPGGSIPGSGALAGGSLAAAAGLASAAAAGAAAVAAGRVGGAVGRGMDAARAVASVASGPLASAAGLVMDAAEAVLSAMKPGQLEQVHYSFQAEDGGAASWGVRRLSLDEGLSGTFQCALELVSEDHGAAAEELEGASCVVEITRGSQVRRLCGVVCRAEALGRMGEYHLARVEVRPALALLGLTRDSRIFQDQSAVDIARTVLSDGLQPYKRSVRADLVRTYPKREYCAQYQESDLDFALRLLSEEGVFFYLDHSGVAEELVLVDSNARCPPRPAGAIPVVERDTLSRPTEEAILTLGLGRQAQPTDAVVVGYDWTVPGVRVQHPPPGTAPRADVRGLVRQLYHLPSPFLAGDYDQGQKRYTRNDAAARQQLAAEQFQARSRSLEGESNVTGLVPGMVIELAGPGFPEASGKYLVTEVRHTGHAAERVHFGQVESQEGAVRYQNAFTCIPADIPYRPAPRGRPTIPGPQTAVVVGPAGEEIFTDEHGRIKVQFHWDRLGQRDDRSSCWIRVAQLTNHTFLPRVGMEVLVHFLDGDPDRPLVVGTVFNGEHTPPYDLPARKTVSTIRTATSPANGGTNEIRFEDAAGQEELYLHAERDLNAQVKRNQSVSVGGSASLSVGGDESASVTGNGSRSVDGTETVTVKQTRTTTVQGDETQSFESARAVTVGADDTLTVKGAQTVGVTGQTTENYDGGRAATVKGAESLTVNGGNKDDTIHGEYNITADTHFKVQQGGDSLLIQNAATLQSVGNILITNGMTAIQGGTDGILSLAAATEIVLACGASCISLKADGTITIMGSTKVNVAAAGGSLTLEPAGATLAGPKISSAAAGIHEITGALVKIN